MKEHAPLSHSGRRQFIKHFALSTAVSFLGGKLWTARLLANVTPNLFAVGRIPIRLSDYPVFQDLLLHPYASVRFAFTDPAGDTYPFVLTRADETTFYAVDTQCTHAGCIVEAYDDGPSAMVCGCHGSEYDFRGQVKQGPATNDLFQYATEFDGIDTVTVLVPGIDMTISDVVVQAKTADSIRLRLQFPTIAYGRYRIHFRQKLTDEPNDILFAILPAGVPALSQILGDGQTQTVYVEAALPQGFFSVALVVDPF